MPPGCRHVRCTPPPHETRPLFVFASRCSCCSALCWSSESGLDVMKRLQAGCSFSFSSVSSSVCVADLLPPEISSRSSDPRCCETRRCPRSPHWSVSLLADRTDTASWQVAAPPHSTAQERLPPWQQLITGACRASRLRSSI